MKAFQISLLTFQYLLILLLIQLSIISVQSAEIPFSAKQSIDAAFTGAAFVITADVDGDGDLAVVFLLLSCCSLVNCSLISPEDALLFVVQFHDLALATLPPVDEHFCKSSAVGTQGLLVLKVLQDGRDPSRRFDRIL